MPALRSRGLSATALKTIAMAAMLLDHAAWAFLPGNAPAGYVWHLLGRIALPILCFFIAEGYRRTRDVKRYALRLLGFALASYLPFLYFNTGQLPGPRTWYKWNILFSLLAGLLILYIQEHVSSPWLRRGLSAGLFLFTLPGDWNGFAVLFILAFGLGPTGFREQARRFSLAAALAVLAYSMPYLLYLFTLAGADLSFLFTSNILSAPVTVEDFWLNAGIQAGVFLALPLLRRYDGSRGGNRASKWGFYLFYPLHLLLLGWLKSVVS